MAFHVDMIPETGIEAIDRALAFVGALYMFFTCAQAFVPKNSPIARLIATFTADLRGVLVEVGRDQATSEPKKRDKHRRSRAREKPK